MDTRPSTINCTNCGTCLTQCPTGAISYKKM
jgi:ferredoxin